MARQTNIFTRLVAFVLTASLALAAVTYIYDGNGRLVKADYGAAGILVYTYDKAGHLVSRRTQVLGCDINGDGAINVVDVQFLMGEAIGLIPAIDDLNGDSVVNLADVQIDVNAALGLGCAVK